MVILVPERTSNKVKPGRLIAKVNGAHQDVCTQICLVFEGDKLEVDCQTDRQTTLASD